MEKEDLLQECAEYFKNNNGFNRLMKKLREKYFSLGKLGGSIRLTGLSTEEKEALSGFFKKNYMHQASALIKVENLQKALENTKFSGLLLEDILNVYFGKELISKKQETMNYLEQRESFFRELYEVFSDTPAASWIVDTLIKKDGAYRTFVMRYDTDKVSLKKDLFHVCRALNKISNMDDKKVRLAVLASEVTGDPHAFDTTTSCGQLLIQGLAYLLNKKRPEKAEEKAELFYQAGILIDDLSSFTICYGLRAFRDEQLHPGWEGFYKVKEPIQISLANIGHITRVVSVSNPVFVVENPAVFSALLESVPDHQDVSFICTYGQVRLASLMVMDFLYKEGVEFYYSGDFDPEGLMIADRLKTRYGQQFILWRYTEQDYLKVCSDKRIIDRRLNKLKNIKSPELQVLANIMRNQKKAGYQEQLITDLVKDVIRLLNGVAYHKGVSNTF